MRVTEEVCNWRSDYSRVLYCWWKYLPLNMRNIILVHELIKNKQFIYFIVC